MLGRWVLGKGCATNAETKLCPGFASEHDGEIFLRLDFLAFGGSLKFSVVKFSYFQAELLNSFGFSLAVVLHEVVVIDVAPPPGPGLPLAVALQGLLFLWLVGRPRIPSLASLASLYLDAV